jgi:hypothetical protein
MREYKGRLADGRLTTFLVNIVEKARKIIKNKPITASILTCGGCLLGGVLGSFLKKSFRPFFELLSLFVLMFRLA